MTPEVIYCGFQRIAKQSYGQKDQDAAQSAAEQEVVLTVKLATSDAYEFELSIHKQADIQTLARTIEAVLDDRRIIVACLIDQGSENVLRWADRVLDVLDAQSIVLVLPVNEDKLLRVLQMTPSRPGTPKRPPSRLRQADETDQAPTTPKGSPRPQLEFIHLSNQQIDTPSVMTPAASPSIASPRPGFSEGKRSASRGLRLLRPNGVRQVSDIVTAPSTPTSASYLPPLPASPMPKAVLTTLMRLCSNAIALSGLLRYCARKKTLCEILFWLDSSVSTVDEDYISRIYLSPDAPLRLNIPREVSTTIEARELLKDGSLSWSAEGFLRTEGGLKVLRLESDHVKYYSRASITLTSNLNAERTKFIETMSMALHPEDTSILSLKERQVLGTRQAILEQVYGQYFPNEQDSAAKYFEYTLDQMTKPERDRLANRRSIFGALFDRRSPPAEVSKILPEAESRRPVQPLAKTTIPDAALAKAHVEEVMPMEDADLIGWTDVKDVNHVYQNTTAAGRDRSVTPTSGKIGKIGGLESNGNGGHRIAPQQDHVRPALSRTPSTVSDDTQASPKLTLSETQRADLLKRQTKLRTLLGVAPAEAIHNQSESTLHDYIERSTPVRSPSPTHSINSRFSATSSRISALRQDQSEDNERRMQARRAAKLYAMFGEHADSASSTPSYRNKQGYSRSASYSEHSPRPGSSASQYSPSYSRVPGRPGSISGQSLYSPSTSRNMTPNSILSKSDGRYQPDRQSPRKGLKNSFGMFRSPKPSALSTDILSNFPSPPSTGSPTANTFNRAFPQSGQYTSSLYQDDESILEVDSDEEDDEVEAIVQDVRTNMKLRQLLGNDAPTSTVT